MQPYFFPYLGYLDLIRNSDRWIIFDTPQYIRHGWVNRNRILHPTAGWQYVVVPLRRHSHLAAIKDIEVNETLPWRQRILGQLAHYRNAPYFRDTIAFVEECLNHDDPRLARLNGHILEQVCRYLGIALRYDYLSDMSLELGPIAAPGDWALRIAQALGAGEYINPAGGESLFDRSAFSTAGITLTIRRPPVFRYECPGYRFEPHLSVIDLLMWNRAEDLAAALEECALTDPAPGDHP